MLEKKTSQKRYLCVTILLSMVLIVAVGLYQLTQSDGAEDDSISLLNTGLNVSVSIVNDNRNSFFSFDDLTNDGVEYKVYADFDVGLSKVDLERGLWYPDSDLWSKYGRKFIKKSGIFDYQYEFINETTTVYKYQVEMHSMIGPDSAKQRQTHVNHLNTDTRMVRKIRFQTFEFPYSDTFELYQIWDITKKSEQRSRLCVWSGILWIDAPMFMIKKFIESDLESSQEDIGKYLRQVLPVP